MCQINNEPSLTSRERRGRQGGREREKGKRERERKERKKDGRREKGKIK